MEFDLRPHLSGRAKKNSARKGEKPCAVLNRKGKTRLSGNVSNALDRPSEKCSKKRMENFRMGIKKQHPGNEEVKPMLFGNAG
jgi:hypothetical protein